MQVSREFKAGILVVLSLLLLFIGFNFFKEFGPFATARKFTAEFEQTEGLSVGDDVQLHGVKIGEVSTVDLDEKDADVVHVEFRIDDQSLDIPTDAELWLISSDILGTKVLDLRIPERDSTFTSVPFYENGDAFDQEHVKIAMSTGDQFEQQYLPIKEHAEELVGRVEDIIVSVNAFWDTSAAYSIDASMYDVRDASDRYNEMAKNLSYLMAGEMRQLNTVIGNVKEIQNLMVSHTNTFNDVSNDFASITNTISNSNIGPAVSGLSATFSDLQGTMKNIGDGKGTVGRFANTSEFKDGVAETKVALDTLMFSLQADPMSFVGFSIFGLRADGFQTSRQREKILDGVLDTLGNGSSVNYKK